MSAFALVRGIDSSWHLEGDTNRKDLWSKSQPGDDVSPDPGAGLDGLPGPLRGVVDGEGEEVVDEHGGLHHAHPHRRGNLLR